MCRCKTYLPGAGAKPLNRNFSWITNPMLLIFFLSMKGSHNAT